VKYIRKENSVRRKLEKGKENEKVTKRERNGEQETKI
jgi:hypothetical protein